MAYLVINEPSGKETSIAIFKRLTSIGKGNNVDINLKNLTKDGIVAYISQASNGFSLMAPKSPVRVTVDQMSVANHHLLDKSTIAIENNYLQFFTSEMPKENRSAESDNASSAVIAYRRLLEFSKRLAEEENIETLLGRLLKEITQLTGAEHGFLVLMEDNQPTIKVKEPKEDLESRAFLGQMSDSIVKKVIEKKEAIIVNDALHDEEFSASLSVINYRLTSVMCAPLSYQGHTFGAIYVANNSFTNAFDKKSLELMTIYSSQAALLVQNALHINALKKRTENLQESLELTKFGGIIGGCQGMQEVFRYLEKIAPTEANVLITGETGTGKEQIARELHERSLRKTGPFVAINCGSLPSELLESELFGHVRGAFLGATQSRFGKLYAAHLGTLYLDEIDEMPLYLQVKLLHALQEQRVKKMGDQKSDEINIRVIAATTNDLSLLVSTNKFREDLYYRLNVLHITIPPLCDRGNDVLVIANFFLQKYKKIYGKSIIGIDENAQNALLNYHWPGNVRQLENRMRRAVVICDKHLISPEDLDIKQESFTKVIPLADALEKFRSRYIMESLERNAGNRTKTAFELGVDPRTIFRQLEKENSGKRLKEKIEVN
jgi:transcriptional regulator with GAF, ATPase, and Fis domain